MKTKHAKFSEKRPFLTPWYAHVRVRYQTFLFKFSMWYYVIIGTCSTQIGKLLRRLVVVIWMVLTWEYLSMGVTLDGPTAWLLTTQLTGYIGQTLILILSKAYIWMGPVDRKQNQFPNIFLGWTSLMNLFIGLIGCQKASRVLKKVTYQSKQFFEGTMVPLWKFVCTTSQDRTVSKSRV